MREEKVNHKGTEVTEQGILKPSGFCPVPAARPKPQAPRLNSNQDPMAGGQPRRGGGRAKDEEAVLFAPRRGVRGVEAENGKRAESRRGVLDHGFRGWARMRLNLEKPKLPNGVS